METNIHRSDKPKRESGHREIVLRSRGSQHGSITRLVSPQDIGELIKPFVFLDYFEAQPGKGGGFGWHPHSGIATLTVLMEGRTDYEDSTGGAGELEAGDVEWMRAGGGVWHTGRPLGDTTLKGFQLWIALPAELEHSPAQSQYIARDQVPSAGPARVVLGRYKGIQGAIAAPSDMTYLHVKVAAGTSWTFDPPAGQTVAWLAVANGALVASERLEGEIAVFEAGEGSISVAAQTDAEFVVGSAVPHPHDLFLGYYSVHTSEEALVFGEAGIKSVGAALDSIRKRA